MGVAAIFYMFAGGGITNGLIRNISAAHLAEEHDRWMSAGITISALTSVALAVIATTLGLFDGGAILGDPFTNGYTSLFRSQKSLSAPAMLSSPTSVASATFEPLPRLILQE